MKTHNPKNERIKRSYFDYLKEASGHSEATIDVVAKALHRFEVHTRFRDFRAFHIEQAKSFKREIAEQLTVRTKRPMSKATIYATLTALKKFFLWLAGQPGYRSRLSYSDSGYFSISEKDARIAKAQRERPVPTIEQIRHVISTMPATTEIERRNRALIAFMLLTGVRDGALIGIKLKHVDLADNSVFLDARDIATKFSKTFKVWFFPVDGDSFQVVADWVEFLKTERLWGLDDPLFPATRVEIGADRQFHAAGLERSHWRSASAVRDIFKVAFIAAELPYFNPHSFRKTLAQFGERICRTPEEFKAWSQNLGHEQVLTTFASYGSVSANRQGDIIQGFGKGR
jgi:integrase